MLRRVADRYRIEVPSLIADRRASRHRAGLAPKLRPGGGKAFAPGATAPRAVADRGRPEGALAWLSPSPSSRSLIRMLPPASSPTSRCPADSAPRSWHAASSCPPNARSTTAWPTTASTRCLRSPSPTQCSSVTARATSCVGLDPRDRRRKGAAVPADPARCRRPDRRVGRRRVRRSRSRDPQRVRLRPRRHLHVHLGRQHHHAAARPDDGLSSPTGSTAYEDARHRQRHRRTVSSVAGGIGTVHRLAGAIRGTGGLGGAIGAPALFPLLTDWYPLEIRARAIGFVAICQKLGLWSARPSPAPSASCSAGGRRSWSWEHRDGDGRRLLLAARTHSRSTTTASRWAPATRSPDRSRARSWSEGWRAAASVATLRRIWYATPFMTAASGASPVSSAFYFAERVRHLAAHAAASSSRTLGSVSADRPPLRRTDRRPPPRRPTRPGLRPARRHHARRTAA